jgi:integrase
MTKHHPKNERIKHEYLGWLEDGKELTTQTVDHVAAALAAFEETTGHKDFATFHVEQARRFKRVLGEAVNPVTKKPLAKATIRARLMAVKAFFQWLAVQPGYKSRVRFHDAEYFNLSANDSRIATARRERPAPDLAQIHQVIATMPATTAIERRDRALIAFAILTGARDNALASFSVKHVDLDQRLVFQDARDVRTKRRKSFTTWFFPVGGEAELIVREWIAYLSGELRFGPEDPLFPQTQMGLDTDGCFAPTGLARRHWSDAGPIRTIFREAFALAGLPYYHPHSFRTTLGMLGLRLCRGGNEEQWSTWSLNLGHENVATTFKSYATVPPHRRAEIMRELSKKPDRPLGALDPATIAALETFIERAKAG